MFLTENSAPVEQVFALSGSFGLTEGVVTEKDGALVFENGKVAVKSTAVPDESGVHAVNGVLKNNSDAPFTVSRLAKRFVFDDSDYAVYSAYNGWQNESEGGFADLITGITLSSPSVRNACGACPFAVLWDKRSGRGTVFHVLCGGAWEMTFKRVYHGGEFARVEVTIGFLADDLAIEIKPGESVAFPEVLWYTTASATDFDCVKLQKYARARFPRRGMPVIYNTWLGVFDNLAMENLEKQAAKAAELGCEYFVVDAGWFGKAGESWAGCRGDWVEKPGISLAAIAEQARSFGMKFGFWIEAECASYGTDAMTGKKAFYLDGTGSGILDFSNPDAREYMLNVVTGLIDKTGAAFVKCDFNADLLYDEKRSAFSAYGSGYRTFFKELKKRRPDVYLEGCASGGFRMTLREGDFFDSFWLSDDQDPYETLRIFKDSLKRLPPQWIEKYLSVNSYTGGMVSYTGESDRLLAARDGTWTNVSTLPLSYLHGFFAGGPIGVSCDLTRLSPEHFEKLKNEVAAFKADRVFYENAYCRLLTDTPDVTVMEFSDEETRDVRVFVFTGKTRSEAVTVYPLLSPGVYALADGRMLNAAEIAENGMRVMNGGNYTAAEIRLKKR